MIGIFNDSIDYSKIGEYNKDIFKFDITKAAISKATDYPLHIGLTEAGTPETGRRKSAIALGTLLLDGIGDTMRVSLTGDPVNEVVFAKQLLQDIGLRDGGIKFVSCPTCGRTQVDLISLANRLNAEIKTKYPFPSRSLNVAVMGCAVNGPGEAREADIGIAGGVGEFLLFKKGISVGKVSQNDVIPILLDEIEKILN